MNAATPLGAWVRAVISLDITACRYPVVFVLPMLGLSRDSSEVGIQIGYSVSDVISKCTFQLKAPHPTMYRTITCTVPYHVPYHNMYRTITCTVP